MLCTGQRRCRTLSPPAARSIFKKQVFFTSLLSKSLLLRQHLETLLFSRVFCCLFAGISVLCTGQRRCRTLTFTHLRTQCAHQADNLAKLWQEFLSVLELIRHGMRSVPTKQALARNYGLSLCPSYFEREKCLSG